MTYRQRLSLLVFTDSIIVLIAIFIGMFILHIDIYGSVWNIAVTVTTLLICHHIFAFSYRLYKKAWEYASDRELLMITKAVTCSFIITAAVQFVVMHDIHMRLLAITWMLHILLIGGSRLCWKISRDRLIKQHRKQKRTLIIGAGSAGMMVARQLQGNNEAELLPIAFIDDNARKHGLHIMGIPVAGGVDNIEQLAKSLAIEHILIAIPSLGKKELNIIYCECAKTTAKTQIIPMLEDLAMGRVSVSQFRDVQVEDLLGRETVKLDMASISQTVKDKVVLVTGAGGSIGSEICRQLAQFHPSQLILLGHGENSIYSIEMELREMYGDTHIDFIPQIADVQDAVKMTEIMNTYQPHVVYHAAAHKHVPLMERNPDEAVKNNVIGTINVAKAASVSMVDTFVMVSTDKAVNPTSVMGATKRIAEMIIQQMDRISETRFVAVRFGNVLGSRGSVIPLFKEQIKKGGPVTVTHPDMMRYFMTIPEASRLVLQAGALASGGEIFILDMGEPVKIVDLARNIIKLSGYTVEEIGIEFTGIRPGEKLFEELLKENEVHEQRVYPKIYVGKSTSTIHWGAIEELIAAYVSMDKEQLRQRLLYLANHKLVHAELLSVSG